jgi:membrane-associated phospholipid phosphatase
MNIATQMIRNNNLSLNEAALVYAKLGMAEADAFIACWKGKYKYSIIRPISYIQQNIDPSWNSLITTPPFPTYCSGHATVSGATSTVLTSFFGDNVKFTDHTYATTFGTRQFNSFYDAASEAAVSRLYGGIHFRVDNEIGLEKGKAIGKNVADLKLKK